MDTQKLFAHEWGDHERCFEGGDEAESELETEPESESELPELEVD